MNISENLTRIKQGKDDIITALQNKGSDIQNNTLISEISTYVDKLEIGGGGGGDTPSVPTELTPKYEGASVFRINVPTDNYEFAINLCNNATKATYDVDWGDGVLESGLTTDEQHHTYSKKGTYDVNVYNISKDITLGGYFQLPNIIDSNYMFIYYLFNNSDNDCWNINYNTKNDYICINILIGKGITSIGSYAFNRCSSLQSIVISEGVKTIGQNAFYQCSSLQSIVISEGVKTIGNSAFYQCSSLQSIDIPNSVTSIENDVFNQCSSLQSIVISEGVKTIGQNAFNSCSSLQSIDIPNSVTSIGNSAFRSCSSLQSVTIPNSVTSIGNSAFYQCSSLQSIDIPNSVTSISDSVFRNCSSLQSVTIPDSVTSIGYYVFESCSSLQSVTIPNSVTSIGNDVFNQCSSLQSIVISEGVKTIGQNVFNQCSSLQSVTIPDSVTSIGDNAFSNCSSLQSIDIPNSVTSIGNYVFSNCSSLQSVTISDNLTSIGTQTFQSCYFLQSIDIPNSVTSISDSVFRNCSSLQSIVISNSVTSIGSSVFSSCYFLQSITCEAMTAPTIQNSSFPTSNFKYTKRYLYVPKDSTGYNEGNWKTYLLDKGWELRYLEDYPKTPTTLKLKTTNNFFHNLQAIGQANLINYKLINDEYIYNFDNKITVLVQYTFYNKVLEEIELPEGLDFIGSSAFSGCTKLSTITCKSMTAPTIQSNTFSSIGTSVPSGTKKVLRVPEGSSGYDSGYWKTYVLDKGYTLEYVPLSEL